MDYSSKGNPTSIEQNPILVRRKPDRRYQYFQEWADALIQTMTVVKTELGG